MSHLLNNIIFDPPSFHLPSPLFTVISHIVAFDRTITCYIFNVLILMDKRSKTSLSPDMDHIVLQKSNSEKEINTQEFGNSLVIQGLRLCPFTVVGLG